MSEEITNQWLEKNCDKKRHHISPCNIPELGDKPYETDFYEFHLENKENEEQPLYIQVGARDENADYVDVEIHNGEEDRVWVGDFSELEDLKTLIQCLTKVNMEPSKIGKEPITVTPDDAQELSEYLRKQS